MLLGTKALGTKAGLESERSCTNSTFTRDIPGPLVGLSERISWVQETQKLLSYLLQFVPVAVSASD